MVVSRTLESQARKKLLNSKEVPDSRDTKMTPGHRMWGGPGKKDIIVTSTNSQGSEKEDIIATPTSSQRASSHDKPLLIAKAQRKVANRQDYLLRQAWKRATLMVHKLQFQRALTYILPQLVCLQHSRGKILPSLMIKDAKDNLQGVRNMRSVVQKITHLCNTAPNPLTKVLDNWSSILTLKTVKAQLLGHCLSPEQAHQQLLAIIASLPMQPRITEVAAEAALHKLTRRLPFIFNSDEDKPCTLSFSEAMQIYNDQKGLCKSQVTKCTNRFKSPEEALQAITNHIHTRFVKQDPTLFQNWSQLMPILAREMQELIEALHSRPGNCR